MFLRRKKGLISAGDNGGKPKVLIVRRFHIAADSVVVREKEKTFSLDTSGAICRICPVSGEEW